MSTIGTLIEKRTHLETAKAEHPELSDILTLLDEMIAAIVDLHMRTTPVNIAASATAACPVPQSTTVMFPNVNGTAVGAYESVITQEQGKP